MPVALLLGCLSLMLGSSVVLAAEDRRDATHQAQRLEQSALSGEIPDSPLSRQQAEAIDPDGQAALEDPLSCLARTLYWEAKGIDDSEKEAVANVVMNRLGHDDYPDALCEVITAGAAQGPCEFSWWCDGRANEAREEEAFESAREVARQALNQALEDRTQGALYFHDRSVMPGWAHEFRRTAETEHFLFYRPQAG